MRMCEKWVRLTKKPAYRLWQRSMGLCLVCCTLIMDGIIAQMFYCVKSQASVAALSVTKLVWTQQQRCGPGRSQLPFGLSNGRMANE